MAIRFLFLFMILFLIFGCSSKISVEEARKIAETSECAKIGILKDDLYYDSTSTNWIISVSTNGSYETCRNYCIIDQTSKTAKFRSICVND